MESINATIQLDGSNSTLYIDGTVVNTSNKHGIEKTQADPVNAGTNKLVIGDLKILCTQQEGVFSINCTAPVESDIRVVHSCAANTDASTPYPFINIINPGLDPNKSTSYFDANIV